jgi:CheY-like chemotaxis protein
MSGVEVVSALRQMGLTTFVVGCTGNALREDQEEYLSAGAHELLPKPVHQSAIEEMLVEARRRRDQEALSALPLLPRSPRSSRRP